jgi:G protein-coupled receptor Mth (Methuselah protein)
LNFSQLKISNRSNYTTKKTDRRRFLKYSLYAFGLPLLVSMLVFISDETNFIPDEYKIGMGKNDCFVDNAFYVFIPIVSVITINIVFYSITAYKIYKVQSEIAWVHKGDNARHSSVDRNRMR